MLRDWLGDWIGTFLGHKGAVWSARLSGGEAAKAVTGSADFSAKVWDTFSGSCLHTFPHEHIVRAVAIDDEGTRILTGGNEKKLRLFDLNNPDAEPREFTRPGGIPAHDATIKSIVWLRGQGQRTIVTAGEDKVVRWWDLESGEVLQENTFEDPILSMERNNNAVLGELLAIASGKRAIFIDPKR